MSVNFGTNNTGRYFTCPDHANFTLTGAFTWLMVIAPYTANVTNPKYFLSIGTLGSPNSTNLLVSSTSGAWGGAISGQLFQTTTKMGDLQFALCYGRRISGSMSYGEINLSTLIHNKTASEANTLVSDGGTLHVGARADLDGFRMAQGYMSWLALLNTGLSDADLAALADGSKRLVDDFSANIVELWDMSANAATITGTYKSHVLTRTGTGFGTDGSDPLPYSSSSTTPISFSGTITDQTGSQGAAFSLDTKPYFTGTATPFTYSLQSGTLPAGLTLASGVISGTPTTVETQTGIVIRGTDTASNIADSNAFSIDISAAAVVVKGIRITLNSRASLQPIPSVTDITARFWDSPTEAGAPRLKTDTASLSIDGVIELNVDSVTSLAVGGTGYLSLYKQGATPEQDLHFAGRVPVSDIGT
jgi:hypothetical protein